MAMSGQEMMVSSLLKKFGLEQKIGEGIDAFKRAIETIQAEQAETRAALGRIELKLDALIPAPDGEESLNFSSLFCQPEKLEETHHGG